MTKQDFLAMSLPYGLHVEVLDYRCDYVGKQYDLLIGILQWSKNGDLWCVQTLGGARPSFDRIKPILRPLSDLTKPIEHEGEVFVPMVRLFEYIDTNYFHEDINLKCINFAPEKIISCEYKVYEFTKATEVILMYKENYTNTFSHIKSFRYNPEIRRFLMRDETENRPLGVAHQLDLFQQLIKWHFDIANLIEKGEAIDINTLENFKY